MTVPWAKRVTPTVRQKPALAAGYERAARPMSSKIWTPRRQGSRDESEWLKHGCSSSGARGYQRGSYPEVSEQKDSVSLETANTCPEVGAAQRGVTPLNGELAVGDLYES